MLGRRVNGARPTPYPHPPICGAGAGPSVRKVSSRRGARRLRSRLYRHDSTLGFPQLISGYFSAKRSEEAPVVYVSVGTIALIVLIVLLLIFLL